MNQSAKVSKNQLHQRRIVSISNFNSPAMTAQMGRSGAPQTFASEPMNLNVNSAMQDNPSHEKPTTGTKMTETSIGQPSATIAFDTAKNLQRRLRVKSGTIPRKMGNLNQENNKTSKPLSNYQRQ